MQDHQLSLSFPSDGGFGDLVVHMAVQFSGVPVEFFHSDVLVHIVDEPDTDGIADSEENNVPPLSETAGNGNGDHIADSTQENVASLHNATDGDYATVAVPDGMRLVAVSVTSPDEDSALAELAAVAGADFPQGLVGFRIEGLSNCRRNRHHHGDIPYVRSRANAFLQV